MGAEFEGMNDWAWKQRHAHKAEEVHLKTNWLRLSAKPWP
jgi:hypothetical protein